MGKYSIFSLIRNALAYHEGWERAWRSREPQGEYDVIIIGGGGHGLATAFYLAKEHGITNVAVIEKGWLGGGNTGRNTTIIRSNYLWDESAGIYEKSLQLYEGLSQELNFNIMLSQRGVLNLAHNLHDLRELERRVNANLMNGIDSEILDTKSVKNFVPIINTEPNSRYPILGASLQRRGGTARHDAVGQEQARRRERRRRWWHGDARAPLRPQQRAVEGRGVEPCHERPEGAGPHPGHGAWRAGPRLRHHHATPEPHSR